MSQRDRLTYYDENWAKFTELRERLVDSMRMARHGSLNSAEVHLTTQELPNQLRERLIEELNAWLPATIERLHIEVRMKIVADCVAEARAILAELGE